MIEIEFSGKYWSMFRELIAENPPLKELIIQNISRFRKNLNDTRLRVHPLQKRMKGKWAFSITDDTRIVFELKGKHRVRFLAIGSHVAVYVRKRKKKK